MATWARVILKDRQSLEMDKLRSDKLTSPEKSVAMYGTDTLAAAVARGMQTTWYAVTNLGFGAT